MQKGEEWENATYKTIFRNVYDEGMREHDGKFKKVDFT